MASLRAGSGSSHRGRVVCLSWLVCLAAAPAVRALDPRVPVDEYVRDTWETQQGLPQSTVMAVRQTRDGYLWLATLGGLARFDGVRFAVFLKDQHVHSLLEDREGALWIGTWGSGLTRYRDGRFTTFTTREGLAHDEVRALAEDRDGSLWIGTNGGLSRRQGGAFTTWTARTGLPHDVVRALHVDGAGRLWIGMHGGGLATFEGGRFVRHVQGARLRADEVVRAIHGSAGGGVWLATDRGLKRYEDGRVDVFTTRDGLPHDDVLTLLEDRAHQLWIGTREGLSRFYAGRLSGPSTAGAEVRALFEDREGNLWVGTYNSGLDRLKDPAFTSLTKAKGLAGDDARAVYEDRAGSLWIGTHNAGVSRLRDGRITTFTTKDGLPSDRVWSATEDAAGTLWVGTFGAGLARFVNGRFVPFRADGLPSDVVRCLLGTRDGSLWVGTDQGLARVRGERVERFSTAEGLLHPAVIALLESRDGSLWIGTRGGLNRLRGGVLDVPPGGRDPGVVLAIREDAGGALWLGTKGRGLWRLENGRWTSYSETVGLPHETVLQILEDDDGHLWLSGGRGIFRVTRHELAGDDPAAHTGVTYDRSDGMTTVECNGGFQPAGWRTRDGRLWFPTMKGVAIIDPRASPTNTVPPPVYVEELRVGGKPVGLAPAPRLDPDARSLEISYVGLSFVAPEKVRFRYKLDGFDDEWVDAGTRRTAYYTRLPPGRYRFRVTASNNSGRWSAAEAVQELSVRPWFYQTWWFCSASAVVVVLAAATQQRLRLRRTRRRYAAILEERTRIARELHDTLAQGLAVVGLQLDALAARLPAAAGDAAQTHLDHAREQVRASLVEARHSVWDLRSPALEEWDLRRALEALAAEVSKTGAVAVRCRLEGAPRRLPEGVERHLLRVAQEAVSNALKHARAESVEIVLAAEPRAVRLLVADDGRGFDPAAVVDASHFGLAGMRERARLMQAALTVARRAQGGTEVGVVVAVDEPLKERRAWNLFRATRRRTTPAA